MNWKLIENRLNELDMNVELLAGRLKLGSPAVYRWKNGACARPPTLKKIAAILGVTIDDLLKDDQPEDSSRTA